MVDPDTPTRRVGTARSTINFVVIDGMKAALKGLPVAKFAEPDRALAFGTPATVPSVICMSEQAATAKLHAYGFRVITQKSPLSRVDSKCSAGQVAKTDPPAGRSVKGAVVALYMSNGKTPAEPNPNPSGGPSPGPGGGGPGRGGGNPPGGPGNGAIGNGEVAICIPVPDPACRP